MRQVERFMMCLIVSIVFLATGAFAHPLAEGRRKIVVFREGVPGLVQQKVAEGVRSRVLQRLTLVNGLAVELPTQRALQALGTLQRHPLVAGVYDDHVIGANHMVQMNAVEPPASELFPWGVARIGTPAVFDLLTSPLASRPRVAIIDTGIDGMHPELSRHIVGGYNARALENPTDFQDENGHGTHMAGIIAAASDGQGIIGAAAGVELVAVKVLDQSGHGYLSDLLSGLQWVAANNIRLVNMSLSFSEGSPLLENITRVLYEAGVIMVAAVGNRCTFTAQGTGANDSGADDSGADDSGADDSGADNAVTHSGCDLSLDPLQGGVNYPARYPWVIAVGATDTHDRVTNYSRSGPEVDVVAPGGSSASGKILSTIHAGGYGLGSGTSQATAHVTGAIAAVLQLAPGLSVGQVVDLLQTTATNLGTPPERQGAGLINVQSMVNQLLGLP